MEVNRLFDALYYQAANYPQEVAVKAWNGTQWKTYSSNECIRISESLAMGFIHKGIMAGEKVAIISQLGSPAWNLVDFALQMIGAVPVPLHASAHINQIGYIAQDADFKICFAANENLANLVTTACEAIDRKVEIFLFNTASTNNSWEKLMRVPETELSKKLEKRKTAVQQNDLATIIYTSGTTGDPKGVMLSHYNIICNINSTMVLLPVHAGQRTLSYLPLSHIFERMVIFTYWIVGASIHYARSVDTILEDLKMVRPHYFTSVPRLLERVHEGLIAAAAQGSGLKRRILKWAIKLGEKYQQKDRRFVPGFWIKRKIADLIVYRHWRKIIGGKVKGVVVGAAALQPRLGRMFSAAGIKIREGYGLTETSPVVAFNRFEPGGNRFGTVGIPIPGVAVKIHEPNEQGEGEVLVKGPNVMMGYYQKPKITKAVIDSDQWFHTGDTGKIVHKHFLQITGRKKDIFKTTTGKYVAPFHVENTLKANIYISQCMVLGSGKPHPGALIIPNFNHLEQWCHANEVHWTAPQFMVLNPKVKKLFAEIIQKQNQLLSKEEKVRQFYLLHQEWSTASGEYGPTLKLIRAAIRDKYKKEIISLFDSKDNLVPK